MEQTNWKQSSQSAIDWEKWHIKPNAEKITNKTHQKMWAIVFIFDSFDFYFLLTNVEQTKRWFIHFHSLQAGKEIIMDYWTLYMYTHGIKKSSPLAEENEQRRAKHCNECQPDENSEEKNEWK